MHLGACSDADSLALKVSGPLVNLDEHGELAAFLHLAADNWTLHSSALSNDLFLGHRELELKGTNEHIEQRFHSIVMRQRRQ